MNIFGVAKESIVDGPGIRYAVFAQGCVHSCEGCHNPESHNFTKNKEIKVQELYEDIVHRDYLDGVTFSGGDPMHQAKDFMVLAKMLKQTTELNIWCYTGYTFEELKEMQSDIINELLKNIDVLIDGKFKKDKKSLSLVFRGSSNQRLVNVQETLKSGNIVEWER